MSCNKEKAIVYLDINNLFHRYKKLDFVQLLKYINSKYNIIRATAYNAIDKTNQNQKKFTTYLTNNGYRCKAIDINENTNIDNMLSTDMCIESNTFNHSVIILVSGDGDYNYPLEQLASSGYKIHIIGPKDNTSLELLKVKDTIDYIEDISNVIMER